MELKENRESRERWERGDRLSEVSETHLEGLIFPLSANPVLVCL